jgi:N-sulfoglucosamine sulfohydrolase
MPMRFLSFLIALLLARAGAADKPNVVLFVCDDLGKQLGCYGDKVARTPNIDQLAKEGVMFSRAFCTTASCSASRSVILSGLHNHANGQFGHQHSVHHFSSFPGVQSLPVVLTKGGYRTVRTGKFHVAPEEVYRFETVLQGSPRNGVEMAGACRPFLEAKDTRPFFLYFCTSDPHRGGIDRNHKLKPDRFGNGPSYAGVQEQVFDPKEMPVPTWLPDTPATRAELAQYYQAVSRVDAGLGRLVALLKETGQYENTLIIFTADNGPAFPGSKTTLYEPGMCLPLIVRTPGMTRPGTTCDALVSWTDLTPTIIDHCKVMPPGDAPPLGGVAEDGKPRVRRQPYEFHGRSFAGIWNDEKPKPRDPVFASHTFHEITMYYPMRVLRNDRYKLILNLAHQLPYPFASDLHESAVWQDVLRTKAPRLGLRNVEDFLHRPRYELYDLQGDPDEVKNLATDPAHKKTLDEMSATLKGLQEKTRDPWVVKYEYE